MQMLRLKPITEDYVSLDTTEDEGWGSSSLRQMQKIRIVHNKCIIRKHKGRTYETKQK